MQKHMFPGCTDTFHLADGLVDCLCQLHHCRDSLWFPKLLVVVNRVHVLLHLGCLGHCCHGLDLHLSCRRKIQPGHATGCAIADWRRRLSDSWQLDLSLPHHRSIHSSTLQMEPMKQPQRASFCCQWSPYVAPQTRLYKQHP